MGRIIAYRSTFCFKCLFLGTKLGNLFQCLSHHWHSQLLSEGLEHLTDSVKQRLSEATKQFLVSKICVGLCAVTAHPWRSLHISWSGCNLSVSVLVATSFQLSPLKQTREPFCMLNSPVRSPDTWKQQLLFLGANYINTLLSNGQ